MLIVPSLGAHRLDKKVSVVRQALRRERMFEFDPEMSGLWIASGLATAQAILHARKTCVLVERRWKVKAVLSGPALHVLLGHAKLLD